MPAIGSQGPDCSDPVADKNYTTPCPPYRQATRQGPGAGGRFQVMEGPDKFHRFNRDRVPDPGNRRGRCSNREYGRGRSFRRGGAAEVETIA